MYRLIGRQPRQLLTLPQPPPSLGPGSAHRAGADGPEGLVYGALRIGSGSLGHAARRFDPFFWRRHSASAGVDTPDEVPAVRFTVADPPYTANVSQDPELGKPNYSAGSAASAAVRDASRTTGPRSRLEPRVVQGVIAVVLAWAFFPILGDLVALQRVSAAKKRIDTSGGMLTGETLVVVVRLFAYIHIVLTTVVAYYWWQASGGISTFGWSVIVVNFR